MEGKQEKIPLILKTNETSFGERHEQVSWANHRADIRQVSNGSGEHMTRAQVNTNEDRRGDKTCFESFK